VAPYLWLPAMTATKMKTRAKKDEDGVYDRNGSRNDLDDGDSEDGYDLEEAGADWLAEQGFDRKD